MLGIETGHVLGSHQVLSQELALVADLGCGCRGHTNYERGVVDGAKDLELGIGPIPAGAPASFIIKELLLAGLS